MEIPSASPYEVSKLWLFIHLDFADSISRITTTVTDFVVFITFIQGSQLMMCFTFLTTNGIGWLMQCMSISNELGTMWSLYYTQVHTSAYAG